jgi:hypothetical protein
MTDIAVMIEELRRLREIAAAAKRYADRVKDFCDDRSYEHCICCYMNRCTCGFLRDHDLLTSYIPT